ncbi:MAG TPA: hypothetical protein VMF31_01480 [Solirubrobacterales bacterium]|nr:hypothetical protein [Solirubrobacterales bacterium]
MADEETTPSDPTSAEASQGEPQGPPPLTPEEQEMLEQQMREVRVEDLLTQTVASVLNLSARRIVKEDEVDLEQARIGIDAVRALVALLPAEVGEAVREPLSQVQMLYAQRAGTSEGDAGAPPTPGQQPPTPESPPKPKGPGLWTPGRD